MEVEVDVLGNPNVIVAVAGEEERVEHVVIGDQGEGGDGPIKEDLDVEHHQPLLEVGQVKSLLPALHIIHFHGYIKVLDLFQLFSLEGQAGGEVGDRVPL